MTAMHTILWGPFDNDITPSSGNSERAYFDTWTECERYLEEHGLTDPDMFTDDPDQNQTGIYVEHIPRYDAVDADPSYRQFLEEEYRYLGLDFYGSKQAFIAGYMAAWKES